MVSLSYFTNLLAYFLSSIIIALNYLSLINWNWIGGMDALNNINIVKKWIGFVKCTVNTKM